MKKFVIVALIPTFLLAACCEEKVVTKHVQVLVTPHCKILELRTKNKRRDCLLPKSIYWECKQEFLKKKGWQKDPDTGHERRARESCTIYKKKCYDKARIAVLKDFNKLCPPEVTGE